MYIYIYPLKKFIDPDDDPDCCQNIAV